MRIEVITRDLSDLDAAPQRMIIDDTVPFHRQWFARHLFWAMRANHSVATRPTTAAVTFEDRRTSQPQTAHITHTSKRPATRHARV